MVKFRHGCCQTSFIWTTPKRSTYGWTHYGHDLRSTKKHSIGISGWSMLFIVYNLVVDKTALAFYWLRDSIQGLTMQTICNVWHCLAYIEELFQPVWQLLCLQRFSGPLPVLIGFFICWTFILEHSSFCYMYCFNNFSSAHILCFYLKSHLFRLVT